MVSHSDSYGLPALARSGIDLLRKFFPRFLGSPIRVRVQVGKAFQEFDSLVGFWGVPNLQRTAYLKELNPKVISISHNEDGNRSKPFDPTDPRRPILCIGGSHTWGSGLDAGDRYSDKLAELTDRQVINIGHMSLGIDQICLAILNKTQKYNPGIIVIEQYPWAIVRITNNYVNGFVKPVFTLDPEGNLKLKKVPWPARFAIFRKSIGSYYAYRKELNEYRSGIDIVSNYDPLSDPIFLRWKTNHYDKIYEIFEKICVVMHDHCRQNGTKLIFALGAIHQQFSGPTPSPLVDYGLPTARLKDILDRVGIENVEMVQEMTGEHSEKDPVIFYDGHMNERGNKIFANVLARELARREWL